jgi:hypothetical protein
MSYIKDDILFVPHLFLEDRHPELKMGAEGIEDENF